ncbi:MAG: hypothetical protein M1546_10485 [Chloroflexi bacterium]|nr:hypothetical protein [Chloroflexota bacterium]
MYERHDQPLLSRRRFIRRQLRHAAFALGLVTLSLAIGMLGYHFLAHLPWIDSFLNASMILTGMGPVDRMETPVAKLFAGCYALFAGLIFLVSTGVLFIPLLHRLFHHFHLETESDNAAGTGS